MEMTEEMRGKLESEGITRGEQSDDLTIVKARYNLDKCNTIHKPDGEKLTKESVLKQISRLMKNCDNEGSKLCYRIFYKSCVFYYPNHISPDPLAPDNYNDYTLNTMQRRRGAHINYVPSL